MVKKDVPDGWSIFLQGSCSAAVLAGARAPRRDTLAPASTSAVLERLPGLEQPDVGNVLFTKLGLKQVLNLTL